MPTKHSQWQSACETEAEFRELRQQLTAARDEAERLRGQLEQSQSHVAEMNACINHAFHIASAKPKDYAIILALGDKASSAWLLRKEADAVEAFAEWADPHWPKSQVVMIKDDARSRAHELRAQANNELRRLRDEH